MNFILNFNRRYIFVEGLTTGWFCDFLQIIELQNLVFSVWTLNTYRDF